MRVFVAGASGAIGEPLIAELLKRGHSVVGMTTSEARAKNLERQGAEAVIADAFDGPAVEAALRRSKAEVVIDELTSLPKSMSDMPKYAAGDRKLRIEGGGNLFRAAHGERCAAVSTAVERIFLEGRGRDAGGRVVSVGCKCEPECGSKCADVHGAGGAVVQFESN